MKFCWVACPRENIRVENFLLLENDYHKRGISAEMLTVFELMKNRFNAPKIKATLNNVSGNFVRSVPSTIAGSLTGTKNTGKRFRSVGKPSHDRQTSFIITVSK